MDREITVKIPEALARDAQEFGLLDTQALVDMLQAEVDRRVNDLVNEEIHAYRAEKQSTNFS